MTGRFFLFLGLAFIHLALVGCSSDSDNGGSGSDTSGSTSGDTSGSDTQSSNDTGTSGADTSGSVSLEPCNVTPPASTKTQLSYADDIKPILESTTCLNMGCHTPFNGVASGGLDLSVLPNTIPSGAERGPAYIPCDPANSSLIIFTYPGCVEKHPEEERMPQLAPALTEAQAALLYQWIAEGGEATFNAATCPE